MIPITDLPFLAGLGRNPASSPRGTVDSTLKADPPPEMPTTTGSLLKDMVTTAVFAVTRGGRMSRCRGDCSPGGRSGWPVWRCRRSTRRQWRWGLSGPLSHNVADGSRRWVPLIVENQLPSDQRVYPPRIRVPGIEIRLHHAARTSHSDINRIGTHQAFSNRDRDSRKPTGWETGKWMHAPVAFPTTATGHPTQQAKIGYQTTMSGSSRATYPRTAMMTRTLQDTTRCKMYATHTRPGQYREGRDGSKRGVCGTERQLSSGDEEKRKRDEGRPSCHGTRDERRCSCPQKAATRPTSGTPCEKVSNPTSQEMSEKDAQSHYRSGQQKHSSGTGVRARDSREWWSNPRCG